MYYEELAKGVKHFKEEGGREVMCQAVEEYAAKIAMEAAMEAAIKTTIEDAISYGMEKEFILTKVNQKYGISKDEAEEIYESCLEVEV